MANEDAQPVEPRTPMLDYLVTNYRSLNDWGAK